MPSTQQPDLSERLLADDEQVLEDVLRTFGPPIRAVLCRKYRGVLSGEDIEDVLAIGLFRFWVNRRRFDERKGTLRVWFFRIVDNAARDVLKHGWHKARRLEAAVEPAVLATFADPRQTAGTIGELARTCRQPRWRSVKLSTACPPCKSSL